MYLGYRPQDMCGLTYPEQWYKLLPRVTAVLRKQSELVHDQLVRKGRAKSERLGVELDALEVIAAEPSDGVYNHPKFGTVKIYHGYDIKSPATEPYNKDDKEKLGLNQFFMGQSPYEHYKGNISDGIYHDEVYIKAGRDLTSSFLIGANGDSIDLSKAQNYKYIQTLVMPAHLVTYYPPTYENKKFKAGKTKKVAVVSVEKVGNARVFEDANSDDGEAKGSFEYYIAYLANGNIATFINSNQISGGDGESVARRRSFNEAKEYPAFYVGGPRDGLPTMTRLKFIEEWDLYHNLFIDEDEEDWQTFLAPLLIFTGAVLALFTGQAYFLGNITSLLGAIGGIAGGISLALSGLAMGTGSKFLAKLATIVGAIGAITGLAGAIKSLGSALIGTQNATTNALSAGAMATKAGLGATANTYTSITSYSIESMAAASYGSVLDGALGSSVAASAVTSVDLSVVMGSSTFSFANASASSLWVNAPSILDLSIDALQQGYKAYSAVNEVFKKPNDFSDDAMPQSSEDSDNKRALAMKANGELDNKLRKYRDEDEVDLGLMDGSLLYMPSLLERIGDKPVSLK